MRYSDIKDCDMNNGEGIRVSLWVSGCEFNCKNCHNKESQDRDFGKLFTEKVKQDLFKMMDEDIPKSLSILGGEPLTPYNREEVINLCKEFKETFPDKSIWLWTGYEMNYIKTYIPEILTCVDVIIDGLFIEGLKTDELMWRGSANQNLYLL